ncbi:MAG: DUF1186 domain-containing protein [Deltaproteobacteria bacterium]|nr:DUF1186 domain-containing protein [Deltaproteobacteria bacterium]MBW2088370.1 DUF1186 domain-containing protein [Deltaproteobacteria bacterium]
MNNRISEILNGIKIFDGIYKKELVDAAIELQEEITPSLIDILNRVLSDPNRYLESETYYDHIYALMLLGHFKEHKAHKIIVDLFSLPDDIPHELFGDITTSDLPVILLNTCGGSMDLIKSMALNKKANDYCRISALHAMAYAVVKGIVSREDVLDFYSSLFTGNETVIDSNFWGLLGNLVCDLYPEELMDTIKKAYEDGLIFPGTIQYEEVEDALSDGKEKCLNRLRIDLNDCSLDNIHDSMSWWACFKQENKPSVTPVFDFSATVERTKNDRKKKKSGKKKAKKKRKIAKVSKKKNRR